ncbi:DUF4097 family beta strand repeat-containing protein [Streptomyces caniscabiei]|uniref:DUF4097 family beta strand repeat-containing protein n=1 Tax=Streptomyces caniscabiei TaxID=2746961 RepID=UPI0038D391A5
MRVAAPGLSTPGTSAPKTVRGVRLGGLTHAQSPGTVSPTPDPGATRRIEVPRGVAVAVRSDDGSVTAKGFAEPLEVRSADGAVRVGDTTGPLELHTDDASVRALGVASRSVRVSTQDGSVTLELGVVPDLVESRSDDGSISIGLPRDTSYRIETGSDDGSVDVSVPRDESSAHVVTAHTQDGSVTVRNVD